jgi:hypothetical protein|tara:strand:+ start:527 stop:943 length:417 start_codon:yes stop_codon:yes gene_type:complete
MSEELQKEARRQKLDWWWHAPDYFSRWRIFPRAFISMYIYLLWRVVEWFMAIPDPNMNQAGLVSVVVGAGAAWFGLYVNSVGSSKVDESPYTKHANMKVSTTTTTSTVEPVFSDADRKSKPTRAKPRVKPKTNKFDIK